MKFEIDVYKIGLKYYDSLKADKNSGLFEYKIIKQELQMLSCNQRALVIINGLNSQEENVQVLEKMKKYDKKIFVMSDSIAFATCQEIMQNCDLILHQDVMTNFIKINGVKQAYSGVPELFYKYLSENYNCANKVNKISFGGNNLDRQDKLDQYKIDSDIYETNIKNYDTGIDKRLDHKNYLLSLANQKFSLIICRKEYRDIDWLTARFCESIAVGTLPLVDIDFCRRLGWIFGKENIVRVSSFDDVKMAMKIDDGTKNKILKNLDKKCKERSGIFLQEIAKEVGEKSVC